MAHARILLQSDSGEDGVGWADERICEGLGVGVATVERVRNGLSKKVLEAALVPAGSRRVYERKLDGDGEAHLIALACGESPEGRNRWTLRLLAERMVALEYVDALSYKTVRGVLKKTS